MEKLAQKIYEKKYIQIIQKNTKVWFSILDALASLEGVDGLLLSELQDAIISLDKCLFYLK